VILVDSSIWVDHLRAANTTMIRLLDNAEVLGHPFVVGELALGNLPRRVSLLRDLNDLPAAAVATHEEAMLLLEREQLHGQGVGYVDLHLLAATRLTPGARLWSRDNRVGAAAERLGLKADLPTP
jgi:predicted nucleic acid-binding protein